MYATSTTNELSFKNICAVLKVLVSGKEMSTVKTIKVSSSNLGMCGAFTVEKDTAVLTDAAKKATTPVVLDCGNGVKIGENDTAAFYIAVPAGTYKDLKVELSSDGTSYSKSIITLKDKDIKVSANTVYPVNVETKWRLKSVSTYYMESEENEGVYEKTDSTVYTYSGGRSISGMYEWSKGSEEGNTYSFEKRNDSLICTTKDGVIPEYSFKLTNGLATDRYIEDGERRTKMQYSSGFLYKADYTQGSDTLNSTSAIITEGGYISSCHQKGLQEGIQPWTLDFEYSYENAPVNRDNLPFGTLLCLPPGNGWGIYTLECFGKKPTLLLTNCKGEGILEYEPGEEFTYHVEIDVKYTKDDNGCISRIDVKYDLTSEMMVQNINYYHSMTYEEVK